MYNIYRAHSLCQCLWQHHLRTSPVHYILQKQHATNYSATVLSMSNGIKTRPFLLPQPVSNYCSRDSLHFTLTKQSNVNYEV